MNIRNISIVFLFLSLGFPGFAGCGSNRPPLGKVEGTVLFDGEPIKSGTIIFAVAGTRDAYGIIVDGAIRNVTTFDEGDGAPVGEAQIAVIVLQDSASPTSTPSHDASPGSSTILGGQGFAIPTRYVNLETSGLTATINKGVNTINLELTR